jgi:hypothetical protein
MEIDESLQAECARLRSEVQEVVDFIEGDLRAVQVKGGQQAGTPRLAGMPVSAHRYLKEVADMLKLALIPKKGLPHEEGLSDEYIQTWLDLESLRASKVDS